MSAPDGKRTARFVLWQLGAGALVFAVLFLIPITMLLEQHAGQDASDGAIGVQASLLQQMSHLAEAFVHAPPLDGDIRRMKYLVRRARANETRVAAGATQQTRRALASGTQRYTNEALVLGTNPTDVALYRRMIDSQVDLMQTLALTEQQRLARAQERGRSLYPLIACSVVALALLLATGWRSVFKARSAVVSADAPVANTDEDDAQLARMEELYLIVASAGTEPAQQIDRALDFASRSLGYDFVAVVEWLDGEQPRVSAILGQEIGANAPDLILEKAIALEASRIGRPVTFRIDRLPYDLVSLANVKRPFSWRHCAAYSFPGDYNDRIPHCGLFLGSRLPRPEVLSEADRQLLRLVGTLVSSSSRNARHKKRLNDLALTDPLTDLPNRAFLNEQLDETIAAAKRSGRAFALHYIDLDGFKNVNDEYGHENGDEVLKLAARRMEKVLRQQETLARIGGDEFVILQTTAESTHDASEVAKRIIDRLSRPFVVDARQYRIGGSIGIAMYPDHGSTGAELLRHADSALYTSKRNGKGVASFYTPLPPSLDESVA